jgi:hypothetical protein
VSRALICSGVSARFSVSTGRGGSTASATFRPTRPHYTACRSAPCMTVWTFSTVAVDSPPSSRSA